MPRFPGDDDHHVSQVHREKPQDECPLSMDVPKRVELRAGIPVQGKRLAGIDRDESVEHQHVAWTASTHAWAAERGGFSDVIPAYASLSALARTRSAGAMEASSGCSR